MSIPGKDLEYAPHFIADAGLDNFFHGGHWGQCLELLTHLCQYSDHILLVTGPSGIGKSALKTALMKSAADKFSFCEIQATTNLTADGLISKIDAKLDQQLNNDLVLLIEDAETLSMDVVLALIQLNQHLEVQNHLQIVLFAAPELDQKLRNSVLKEEFVEHVHVIELEPLTLSELEAFLSHQWRFSGNEGASPFDKATCKKIHSLSGGVPGKVQQLAAEFKSKNKTVRGKRVLSPTVVGFVVLFGLLFCLLAFLWPEADKGIITSSSQLTSNRSSTIVTDAPVVANISAPEGEVLAAAEELNSQQTNQNSGVTSQPVALPSADPIPTMQHKAELAALEKKLLDLQQELNAERTARQQAELKMQAAIAKQSVAKLQETKAKDPVAKKASKNTTSTVQKLEPTANNQKLGADLKYILQAQSQNYTLQLFGASSEQKVKDFIKTNNLNSQARYFRSTYQGKPWYVVIYGNFKNRTAALTALEKLPQEIKKLRPWPREYSYIQRAIKKS